VNGAMAAFCSAPPANVQRATVDDIFIVASGFVRSTTATLLGGSVPLAGLALIAVVLGPHAVIALRAMRAVLSSISSVVSLWRRFGAPAVYKRLLGPLLRFAMAYVPGVAGLVDKEVRKTLAGLERELLGDGDGTANVALPPKGKPASELMRTCADMRADDAYVKKDGKLWGGLYGGADNELPKLQADVWAKYNSSNALYPKEFASLRKMEAELVSMTVGLVHGHEVGACGLLASGGTEAVLLAALAYREHGRTRGIGRPQIVCCISAHPAIFKARRCALVARSPPRRTNLRCPLTLAIW